MRKNVEFSLLLVKVTGRNLNVMFIFLAFAASFFALTERKEGGWISQPEMSWFIKLLAKIHFLSKKATYSQASAFQMSIFCLLCSLLWSPTNFLRGFMSQIVNSWKTPSLLLSHWNFLSSLPKCFPLNDSKKNDKTVFRIKNLKILHNPCINNVVL